MQGGFPLKKGEETIRRKTGREGSGSTVIRKKEDQRGGCQRASRILRQDRQLRHSSWAEEGGKAIAVLGRTENFYKSCNYVISLGRTAK